MSSSSSPSGPPVDPTPVVAVITAEASSDADHYHDHDHDHKDRPTARAISFNVGERVTPITLLVREPIPASVRTSFKERFSPNSPAPKTPTPPPQPKGSLNRCNTLGVANYANKYPKYARRLLELDTNGDGILDEDEVEAALRDLINAESQNKMLKWMVVALTVMTMLLIGSTFGVSVAAAILAKDTKMENGVVTDKSTGWAAATGPSYGRNMPAGEAMEQLLFEERQTNGTTRRRLLTADDFDMDPVRPTASGFGAMSSGPLDTAVVDASEGGIGIPGRYQRRRLMDVVPSLYGWVNAYSIADTYTGLSDSWYTNNGIPRYATVLVVPSNTPQSTIDALASNIKFWCPDLKGAQPDTTKMEGFFLSVYYCDSVFQAEAAGGAVPDSYSCGCRLAIAKTKCKIKSDPQSPMDLTCAQDTTFVDRYKANAMCTIKSYRCPSKTVLANAYSAGVSQFGSPGFTLTSGGSMSTSSGTSSTSTSISGRRLLSHGSAVMDASAEGITNPGRRLQQFGTDSLSIVLDRVTSNTQSTGTSGNSGWGR